MWNIFIFNGMSGLTSGWHFFHFVQLKIAKQLQVLSNLSWNLAEYQEKIVRLSFNLMSRIALYLLRILQTDEQCWSTSWWMTIRLMKSWVISTTSSHAILLSNEFISFHKKLCNVWKCQSQKFQRRLISLSISEIKSVAT